MIELNIVALKYEINYKNNTYIVEAIDYFDDSDETKWLVLSDYEVLTKSFEFGRRHLIENNNDYVFNTKDEAVNALTTYLSIEDRLQKERAKYTNRFELPFLHDIEHTHKLGNDFLSVHHIEAALNKKGCFRINKSNRDQGGVQVCVTYIHNMLLLEKVIKEIAEENNCKVIDIYNYDVPHSEYSSPLYYYWQCGNDFVRQFALLKHIF